MIPLEMPLCGLQVEFPSCSVLIGMSLLDFMSCVSGVLPQIGSGWLFSLACSVDQRVAMQKFSMLYSHPPVASGLCQGLNLISISPRPLDPHSLFLAVLVVGLNARVCDFCGLLQPCSWQFCPLVPCGLFVAWGPFPHGSSLSSLFPAWVVI